MKKYIISLLGCLMLLVQQVHSQNLNKIWERLISGKGKDYADQIIKLDSNRLLLTGRSSSNKSGDFLDSNYGEFDVFVAFLDSNANMLQQKFFGGTSTERLGSVIKVRSGGYCLLASSSSQVSGIKTMPTYKEPSALFYSGDLWLLRLDDQLNILWQKGFGGTNIEYEVNAIIETSDGGFLIASVSNSDSSGNKTTKNIKSRHTSSYSEDIWVLKLDSLGNIEWQKSYGGEGDDNGPLYILPCPDGNYILAGETTSRNQSQLGGGSNYITKTTLLKNNISSLGRDAWLFKIDPLGNPVWDSSYADSVYDASTGGYGHVNDRQKLFLAHNTPDSCVIVIYYNHHHYFWRKVNQQGACIEEKYFHNANLGTVQSCIPTQDGGYLFTGYVTAYKMILHKIDANFELEWTWQPGLVTPPSGWGDRNISIELDYNTYLFSNIFAIDTLTWHDIQLTKFAPWQPSSIAPEQHAQLALYPNPGTGAFKLQFPNSAQRRIQVLNLQGQLLQSFTTSDAVVWLQLDAPAGTYLVKVEDDHSSYTAQLIKQ